ncbi:MAG: N-acetyltransferase [Promethearchaeota archaeon]|nr:MAG: N-acetyltransferase [Candidatus Lokiarchaeota archaeon]
MEPIEIVEQIHEDNLFLRKVSKEDDQFYYKSLKIDDMTQYLSLEPLKSLKHSKKMIDIQLKKWKKGTQFNYIIEIEINHHRKKMGAVSLWNMSWRHRRCEIGIWMLPKFWNKGYAKKALGLIKTVAFIHLKLNRLEAHIALQNNRSIKLFEQSGFKREGVLKEYLYFNGKLYDAFVYAFLKTSFFRD